MGTRSIPQLDGVTSPVSTGVVVALRAEARTTARLRSCDWRIAVGGVGAERALQAATALVDSGAKRLLVWGVAAALQPQLRPGALVVPREVLAPGGERHSLALDWRQQLLACMPPTLEVHPGPLVTSDQLLADAPAKAALARQTGAFAVDMETANIAALAADRGVPCVVVRAIADPLQQALPQVVLRARTDRILALSVALRLVLRPRDCGQVFALGRNMRAAKRSLVILAQALASARCAT